MHRPGSKTNQTVLPTQYYCLTRRESKESQELRRGTAVVGGHGQQVLVLGGVPGQGVNPVPRGHLRQDGAVVRVALRV